MFTTESVDWVNLALFSWTLFEGSVGALLDMGRRLRCLLARIERFVVIGELWANRNVYSKGIQSEEQGQK